MKRSFFLLLKPLAHAKKNINHSSRVALENIGNLQIVLREISNLQCPFTMTAAAVSKKSNSRFNVTDSPIRK
jgi:hypothetical protein